MSSHISAVELAALLGQPTPTVEQAAVIESRLEPAVVIAGAGSGKTETMAARVVWLVANRRVRPDAVLGLTFTRKAAAELSLRIRRRLTQWRHVVERELPDDQAHLAELLAGEPTVLTYAAYAGRLVAEHALRLGAEPDARLISQAVSWQLADEVSRRHPLRLPADIGAPSSVPKYLLAMAGQLADHLVEPETVGAFTLKLLDDFDALPLGKGIRSEHPGKTKEFYASLRHRLELLPLVQAFAVAKQAIGAVDFADQMTLAASLARLPEVAAIERERFAAVLLDEYQDTGHAQVETLRGLFGQGHPVSAVGDPFQSIYGWRGASAGNIGRFAAAFPRADGTPATVYPLATSFRNDRLILDVANTVAAPLRSGPTTVELRPAGGAGPGSVDVARLHTVEDEAWWVAERLAAEWAALPVGGRTAAVLVRRRSQIPVLAEALQGVGLPVEVVGLGGLLTTPEVVDIVSTLRVLVRHDTGTAVARLLTGARWRIGTSDLAALRSRARYLARPFVPSGPELAGEQRPPAASAEFLSLVEALDDLGPAEKYSAEGFRRLSRLSEELRRLRRRITAPLPDLVADVERTIGVDIEVAARPDRAEVGRVHVDRFLDVAADFANEADEATLTAFLSFLEAAEEEENGLDAGEIVVDVERVQLLTVHGAKGLEWDVVAVPGLVGGVFPADPRSINWTRARQELPGPLRGDRDDLPELDLRGVADRKEVRDLLDAHHEALVARHAEEERRLAYVALTRAKSVLLTSGYVWDTAIKPRAASQFLLEARELGVVHEWVEPEPEEANPLTLEARSSLWPLDPLGPFPGDRGPGRRAAVEAGAALVRAALRDATAPGTVQDALPLGIGGRAEQWHDDVDRLLAERARLARGASVDVELPEHLSVTQLVELQRAPDELARSIRRPLPRRPAPLARRGTAFHAWLESLWETPTLLDIDELPGSADDTADDSDLDELRAAFLASEWAQRTPTEVEVPFEMSLADAGVVRGRMDAVFGNSEQGWQVVDWKTGAKPTGAAARAVAVQLAAYRLAWARLRGIPDDELHRVRAAFHYVRSGETVEPTALLDAEGLVALLRGGAAEESG
ncbi:ATP-dependent DNA helicase [Jatrophihabitans sp.]|uniref:ATP-dependent DNA helicase n=1 Tax=Jatrophihabitans sp. TaxID=1932789 RepID=UPI0030C7165D|nr:putative ATP-dependent helicase [Jatrophihabitans sp.]